MDLKSGSLFWPQRSKPVTRHPPLQRNLRCDVAIVGAGLTGALIAYRLTKSGFNVALFEKRDVAQGSTSASTALILYEIDVPLHQLIQQIGKTKAERAYRLCRDAIFEIEGITKSLRNPHQIASHLGRQPTRTRSSGSSACSVKNQLNEDSCGFARRKSLYVASSKRDLDSLQRELRARTRVGLDVTYVSPVDLRTKFGISAHGAILSTEAAVIDPYRFTQQLVEAATQDGLQIFGATEIVSIEDCENQVRLRTSTSHTISAKTVIIAAGYESNAYIAKGLVRLKSTYALATAPLNPGSLRDVVIWETARPYAYLRTTNDGRVLIGGEDEDFYDPQKRDQLLPQKVKKLETKLRRLCPELEFETDRAWAGTFCETKDGLPLIGSRKRKPNILYALCYGANGTNFAMIAANLIHDRLSGQENPDWRLFSLYR